MKLNPKIYREAAEIMDVGKCRSVAGSLFLAMVDQGIFPNPEYLFLMGTDFKKMQAGDRNHPVILLLLCERVAKDTK